MQALSIHVPPQAPTEHARKQPACDAPQRAPLAIPPLPRISRGQAAFVALSAVATHAFGWRNPWEYAAAAVDCNHAIASGGIEPASTESVSLLEQTVQSLYDSGVRKYFVIGQNGFGPAELPVVNTMTRALRDEPEGVVIHALWSGSNEEVSDPPTTCTVATSQVNRMATLNPESAASLRAPVELAQFCETASKGGVGYWPMDASPTRRDLSLALVPRPNADVVVLDLYKAIGQLCAPASGSWVLKTPWNRNQTEMNFTAGVAVNPSDIAMHNALARARRLGPAALLVRHSDLAALGVDSEYFSYFWRGQNYSVMEQVLADGDRMTILVGNENMRAVNEFAFRTAGAGLTLPNSSAPAAQEPCQAESLSMDRSKVLADELAKYFEAGVTKAFIGERHGTSGLTEIIARVLQAAMRGQGEVVHFFREMVLDVDEVASLAGPAKHHFVIGEMVLANLRDDAEVGPAQATRPAEEAMLMELLEMRGQLAIHPFVFSDNTQTLPMEEFLEIPGRAVASCGLSHAFASFAGVNQINDPWREEIEPQWGGDNVEIKPDFSSVDEAARAIKAQESMWDGLRKSNAKTPTILVVPCATFKGQDQFRFVKYCVDNKYNAQIVRLPQAGELKHVDVLIVSPQGLYLKLNPNPLR